eukprot:CAMPEP_0116845738 /NCGR_PEP_ID=MMETSP0418-20121206/13444_1 /TAXON_ID=1158023 /ORGANISM="Astrosyne radiata, Strain 13vi08-1A" /LENGTH=238 /DNA_ID=CAMNT_0004476903 /DNA_START=49 /DNA_END=765 /DNA_ORIENTATION=-
MKLSKTLSVFLIGSIAVVAAFSPQHHQVGNKRPFGVVTKLPMSEEGASSGDKKGLFGPIEESEQNVEFTAGVLGGVAGFAVGGPVLGALGAALANYLSKNKESEASTVISTVSKSSLQVYNYLRELDGKYDVLKKAQTQLETSLEDLKSQDNVDEATVAKVQDALSQTKNKIEEINNEYDLVGSGKTALGVVGELVEKAVDKFEELNEEYKLTDKAKEALGSAVAKAKETADKASSKL